MKASTIACLFLVLAVLVGVHQVISHGDFYELEDAFRLVTHEIFMNGLAGMALTIGGLGRMKFRRINYLEATYDR